MTYLIHNLSLKLQKIHITFKQLKKPGLYISRRIFLVKLLWQDKRVSATNVYVNWSYLCMSRKWPWKSLYLLRREPFLVKVTPLFLRKPLNCAFLKSLHLYVLYILTWLLFYVIVHFTFYCSTLKYIDANQLPF